MRSLLGMVAVHRHVVDVGPTAAGRANASVAAPHAENAVLPSATRNAGTTGRASDTNHDEGLVQLSTLGRAILAPSDDGRSNDASPAPTPAAAPRPEPRRG